MPRYGVVMDFDGTLTAKTESLFSVVDRHCLAPEYLARMQAVRERYMPGAKAGTLTKKEEREWFFETHDVYIASGLTRRKIADALSGVQFREGVADTFWWLAQRKVPVAVISYGCADFIETVLRNGGIAPLPEIYAARLIFNAQDLVVDWDRNTPVFPDTKGWETRAFAEAHDIALERVFAVGDSGGDANLGFSRENRFGIARDEREAEALSQFMGTVAVTESFIPALRWLQERIS